MDELFKHIDMKEYSLGKFLKENVYVTTKPPKNEDYCEYNDIRLFCDICDLTTVGSLEINYGKLKDQNKKVLLNDVRILYEDKENKREYNIHNYYECRDKKYFKQLYDYHKKYESLYENNIVSYTNIQYCEEAGNERDFQIFEFKRENNYCNSIFNNDPYCDMSFDEIMKNDIDCILICGKCNIYLKMLDVDIPLQEVSPLKYFWRKFIFDFEHDFYYENENDKKYIYNIFDIDST